MTLGAALFVLAAAQSPGDQPIPPVSFPEIVSRAADPQGFVPKGWKLEAKAEGDLNRDGLADAAIVLHMDDPRNLVSSDWAPDQKYDSNPRMLAVVFGRKDGGYDLAASDHALIPRLENQNQEDPFDGVAIVNGTLRLDMHVFMSAGGWWMGNYRYTFRWQDGAFKLIGYDRNGVTRNTGETDEISINYLTGRKLIKTGSISSDVDKVRREAIRQQRLISLDEVGDGLMFYPDER